MKEVVIDKNKLVNNLLPKHLILNNNNIFDKKTIVNSFNEYFLNVGLKLACEILQSQRSRISRPILCLTIERCPLSQKLYKSLF